MPETVILLHGLWMPALVMSVLAMRLRRCGYRVRLFAYHSLSKTLEHNALKLADFVREQGDARVHLVGHSLGGLVILQALQAHPELVSGHVVLLGSPVQGKCGGAAPAALRDHALDDRRQWRTRITRRWPDLAGPVATWRDCR